MSFEPTKEQLIDFVYGNLPESESIKVEQSIKQNATVKEEVDALNQSRNFLRNLEDEEVLEPDRFVWELAKRQNKPRSIWPILSVAASLSILLVLAYATQFRVSYGSFELAFGTSSVQEQPALSGKQIQDMIDNSIIDNNVTLASQLEDVRSDFKTQLAANNKLQLKDMERIAANYKELPKEQVETYIAQLGEANRTMVNEFFTASAVEQKEYMNTILTDFYAFLDNQRKEDLLAIQASLNDMEYNNMQKTQQTDQILASILTTVNDGSMGQ